MAVGDANKYAKRGRHKIAELCNKTRVDLRARSMEGWYTVGPSTDSRRRAVHGIA